MAVIKTLRVPFNLFDQIRHLELEDDKGLRIVFSCRTDCQLTLQYASDDSVYEEFIMICRQHHVPFKIGICGIIEEEEMETEYVRTPTGKKRKTDWTCLL